MPDTPTDPSCIFCKIVAGEIPCHKLYEDDHVLAFLDIGPLSRGHSLVIPKKHYDTIDQMPPDEAAACMAVVPRLSRAILEATGAEAWNVLQNNGKTAGQAVGHVHVHIIPRAEGDGLGFRWPAGELDNDTARLLREAIYRTGRKLMAGRPPDVVDVATINAAARKPPLRPQWRHGAVVQAGIRRRTRPGLHQPKAVFRGHRAGR